MGRLFILGNGYDIARGRNTKYIDFKKWIENDYIKENELFQKIYEKKDLTRLNNVNQYGSCAFDIIKTNNKEEKAKLDEKKSADEKSRMAMAALLLLQLFDDDEELWDDFEGSLGSLKCEEIIKKWEFENNSKGIVSKPFEGCPVDHETALVTSIAKEIVELFTKWIKSLENYKIDSSIDYSFEKKTVKKINDNDVVIIFNYTDTFETIMRYYGENIIHIHGDAKSSSSVIVGHNEPSRQMCNPLNNKKDYIDDFIDSLAKRPDKTIKTNHKLWEKLTQIAQSNETFEVYEYGWKGIGVDSDYMKKFAEIIKQSDNYIVNVNDYRGAGEDKRKKWISFGIDPSKIKPYV